MYTHIRIHAQKSLNHLPALLDEPTVEWTDHESCSQHNRPNATPPAPTLLLDGRQASEATRTTTAKNKTKKNSMSG